MATTITVSTRVKVEDANAADVLIALQSAQKDALGKELLSGTVKSDTIFTSFDSGVTTKTTKTDTVFNEGPSEADLNEAWGV